MTGLSQSRLQRLRSRGMVRTIDRFAELVVDWLRTYVRRNGPLDLAVG